MFQRTVLTYTAIAISGLMASTSAIAAQAESSDQTSVEYLQRQLDANDRLEQLRRERYAANRRIKEIEIEEMQIRETVGMSASKTSTVVLADVSGAMEKPEAKKPAPQNGQESKPADVISDVTDNNPGETPKDKFETNFGGIEFGAGIAFTYDLGKNDRVSDAQLVNGVVRINKSENVRARLVLESHYFFTPKGSLFGLDNGDGKGEDTKWGVGPFVALQPGGENLIEAVGAGLMIGFRRSEKSTESFNIGVGVMYDINSKTLGDGLFPNEPLPMGETEIRFREQDQNGLLIMSSYSF